MPIAVPGNRKEGRIIVLFYDGSRSPFLPVVPGLADVAGAGDGQLEGGDVQPLLVGVGEEADKVVLLQALRVVLVVDIGAGRAGVPKMTKSIIRSP